MDDLPDPAMVAVGEIQPADYVEPRLDDAVLEELTDYKDRMRREIPESLS